MYKQYWLLGVVGEYVALSHSRNTSLSLEREYEHRTPLLDYVERAPNRCFWLREGPCLFIHFALDLPCYGWISIT